jgi:hypothetical protein
LGRRTKPEISVSRFNALSLFDSVEPTRDAFDRQTLDDNAEHDHAVTDRE